MGSTWTPTGSLEIGIDGYIELFDPSTGLALGTVVAAQSKALTTFANDTHEGFDYWCEQRDIDYWRRGNMPVILVVSRPAVGDAYWIAVKDYFSRPENASGTRVHFSKTDNVFNADSLHDLLVFGRPATAGLYLAPLPKPEELHSNLLQLESMPDRFWMAETRYRSPGEVWAELRKAGEPIDGAWLLSDKRIYSFHDLSEPPWSAVCEDGTWESNETKQWSESVDVDAQRDFVRLLNQTLRAQIGPAVRYWAGEDCFAYVGSPAEGSKKVSYKSLKRESSTLTAVRVQEKKVGDRIFTWLRHMAFRGQFRRLDGSWFLEITPTYRFTWDGIRLDRFHEERLKTIKRYEGNRAVLSTLLFWAHTLGTRNDDLFGSARPQLVFGDLLKLGCEVGIDDKRWSAADPRPPRDGADDTQLLLPDMTVEEEE